MATPVDIQKQDTDLHSYLAKSAVTQPTSMDTQQSFVPSEFAGGPTFLNGAQPQFNPTFLPFGSMEGIDGSGAVPGREPQVSKLVVIDNLLESVLRTAKDAREAYSRGRDFEGNQSIAELKAAVDLISALALSSSSISPPHPSAPASAPAPTTPDKKRVSPTSAGASRKTSLEDASRKRCASAQGDRILKSLKLEPKEEALPLTLPPPPPPPLLHPQTFPQGGMHNLPQAQPIPFAETPPLLQHPQAHPPIPPPHSHPHPRARPHPLPVSHTHSHSHALPQQHHQHPLPHSLLPLVPNSKPPPPAPAPVPSPAAWPDPALIPAPQIMPPPQKTTHFHVPQRSASYSGTYPFAQSTPSSSAAVAAPVAAEEASRPSTSADSSSPDIDGESDAENPSGRGVHSAGGTGSVRTDGGYIIQHSNNDIPQDLRLDVDRIFFQFLSMICSDLDATDSKGEPIHQPLMAKKMQRLDESPDFRPFKFRIQAFTNGFLEELAKQGLPEEIIPMKKVRHYLWTNPYISRFNEDGKKAKSKGNHIWNIDAKKAQTPESGWHFRPFRRKIAGSFPSVAYIGLRWQFQPRVWDPQASRSNVHMRFSSPSLPPWLSWNGDILAGTPGPDTQSGEIVVEARFTQDGKDVVLSHKYFLSVAPLTREESNTFMGPRRSSLGSERRAVSDSAALQVTNVLPMRSAPPPAQAPVAPAPYQEALTVVTEAIKAVSIEAHSVQAAPNPDPEQQIQLQTFLTRQEQVLTVTAHAINDAMSDPSEPTKASSALARAGTDVVICALHKVAADHSAVIQMTTGLPAELAGMQEVTMQEVSSATKTAVAQAVEQTNTLTSPIDVMLTAETIITQAMPPISSDPSQFPIAGDGVRPNTRPTSLNGSFAPDAVPTLADYAMTDAIPP